MKAAVINSEGSSTGKSVNLPASIFGVEPNEHAIYLAVKQYMHGQRQGTHKSKERGEIKGSTKKIKKQKGTGTARAGSIKSPLFRSGGRIFGPKPRNYDIKLNKKVRSLARNSALTLKAKNDSVMIVEDFTLDVPRTKTFKSMLEGAGIDSKKTLLVTSELDPIISKSASNLPKAHVVSLAGLSTYGIVSSNTVLFTQSAIDQLSKNA